MSDIIEPVFHLIAEMHREAAQAATFTYKPADGWTDPDMTKTYSSIEALDSLCIGQAADGQPLYYGYTVEQIKEMAEWNLSGSERHVIATSAQDATGYLLALVRYVRHKMEQAVKDGLNPFTLVRTLFPDIFNGTGAHVEQTAEVPFPEIPEGSKLQ